jgi:hypothetical protein
MVKQSGMFEAVAVAAVAAVEPGKVACDRFIEWLDTMRSQGFYAQSCEILKPSGYLVLGDGHLPLSASQFGQMFAA